MRRSTLIFSLALCALVAITPLVVWGVAELADGIDDVGLGMLAVSVPVGLGMAAVLLAIHGLLVNRELADALDEEFAAIASSLLASTDEPVAVGAVPVGRNAGATVAVSPEAAQATVTMAAVDVEEPTDHAQKKPRKIGKAGKAAGDAATRTGGRLVGRQVRRTQSKLRWAVQKEISNTFRGMGPKV